MFVLYFNLKLAMFYFYVAVQNMAQQGFHLFILTQYVFMVSIEKETNLRSFILRDLLPSSLDSYYRYTGSLTTPPCSKVVEWIVFSRPVYLSHTQVRSVLSLSHTHSCQLAQTTLSQNPFAHRH